jgi:hypothetical protein
VTDLDKTIEDALRPEPAEGRQYGGRPWRYEPDLTRSHDKRLPWIIVDATGRPVCAVPADVEVLHLVLDAVNGDLVSATDIAGMAGCGVDAVAKWTQRYREGSSKQPFPVAHGKTSSGSVWLRRQVTRWLVETRRMAGRAA